MKKKTQAITMVFFTVLINACFFPVIHFNPVNPVEQNLPMGFVILLTAAATHRELGFLEAKLDPKRSVFSIAAFHILLVAAGLAVRYLLELGEISNTYNFTWYNILFQTVLLSSISTGTYLFHVRKSKANAPEN